MAKKNKKQHRKQQQQQQLENKQQTEEPQIENESDDQNNIKIKKLDIVFKTKAQEEAWNLIEKKEITFISGPAGTGKSHLSLLKALDLLKRFPNKYKKIIISKPAIESEEQLGFLPGDVDEKLDPYLFSSKYIFRKILGDEKTKRMIERKQIEIMALAYIRGINLDDCIFVLEEAQNCTKKQIKTILTRIGDNCKYIINGDTTQIDTKIKMEQTGLYFAMNKLCDVPQIGVFKFDEKDIIRNPLISIILDKLKE